MVVRFNEFFFDSFEMSGMKSEGEPTASQTMNWAMGNFTCKEFSITKSTGVFLKVIEGLQYLVRYIRI